MHPLKVLILEDNAFQLMALHQMLNANGIFDVLTAESVESARRSLANRGTIDIAICDLYMDGPDGLEMIRHLAQGHLAQALIILSSAEPDVLQATAVMARQQGLPVLGCLAKPASVVTLGNLLAAYEQQFELECRGLPLAQVNELLSLEQLQQPPPGCEQEAIVRHCVAHFQPRASADGRIQGIEALARWQHPELGLLLPASFVPTLQYAGLLDALNWQVLELAIEMAVEIRLSTQQRVPMAVRIHPRVLEQSEFARRLEATLQRFSLPPQVLTLEIIRVATRELNDNQAEQLLRLRMLGCQLCLGDFAGIEVGAQRLLELPFSELKVPAQYVTGLAADPRKAELVAGALNMARRMGLRAIVAGVETRQDYRAIKALGEPIIQGGYIALPMNGAQLLRWLISDRQRLAREGLIGWVESQDSPCS